MLALIGLGLHSLYIGGYLSAWFVSLVVALFALMSLSIPRKIVVKKATVEILCLLDMTEIPRMEIASVQRVDPRQMRWVVPLFGGYGFFGYYGYYFDLKTFEKVVVYASEWKNLVEIVDIYEQRYYVSRHPADELVALLQSEGKRAPVRRALFSVSGLFAPIPVRVSPSAGSPDRSSPSRR